MRVSKETRPSGVLELKSIVSTRELSEDLRILNSRPLFAGSTFLAKSIMMLLSISVEFLILAGVSAGISERVCSFPCSTMSPTTDFDVDVDAALLSFNYFSNL